MNVDRSRFFRRKIANAITANAITPANKSPITPVLIREGWITEIRVTRPVSALMESSTFSPGAMLEISVPSGMPISLASVSTRNVACGFPDSCTDIVDRPALITVPVTELGPIVGLGSGVGDGAVAVLVAAAAACSRAMFSASTVAVAAAAMVDSASAVAVSATAIAAR